MCHGCIIGTIEKERYYITFRIFNSFIITAIVDTIEIKIKHNDGRTYILWYTYFQFLNGYEERKMYVNYTVCVSWMNN